jgi:hypothetical protein
MSNCTGLAINGPSSKPQHSCFTRFSKVVPFSRTVYQRRWCTWPSFLSAFRDWVATQDPTFPFVAELDSRIKSDSGSTAIAAVTSDRSSGVGWQSTGGSRFVPFLNFRGLQHAPIAQLFDDRLDPLIRRAEPSSGRKPRNCLRS